MDSTLQGYIPVNADRHHATLARKRQEYRAIVHKYFGEQPDELADIALDDASVACAKFRDLDESVLHQIGIDVLRTCPADSVVKFQSPPIRRMMLRVLYCWSIRRPATGYVQGINDLVTPFIEVFASPSDNDSDMDQYSAEADVFWCFSTLLDGIQDNYTFNQSGIHRQVALLYQICKRIDPSLVGHLDAQGLQFLQFAFRWMNCLLLREFKLPIILRLWDAFLAEPDGGFKEFHVFVCAAFLLKWRRDLIGKDFQDLMMFLQSPPTGSWTDRDVEMLTAEAFVLKNLWGK